MSVIKFPKKPNPQPKENTVLSVLTITASSISKLSALLRIDGEIQDAERLMIAAYLLQQVANNMKEK